MREFVYFFSLTQTITVVRSGVGSGVVTYGGEQRNDSKKAARQT